MSGTASRRQRPLSPTIEELVLSEPPPATRRAWVGESSGGRTVGCERTTLPERSSTCANLAPFGASRSSGVLPSNT